MKKPPGLQTGDRIHVVIPASPVRADFFNRGIAALRAMGFAVTHGNSDRKWRYLAGTDAERAAEINAALSDPGINAVFCARGGYGSGRLLDDTSFPRIQSPKILLGCSDITSLHQYFQEIHRWVVFHGPMPAGDFARGQVHVPSFQQALQQHDPYDLMPDGMQTLAAGSAEGILKGGCLSILHATLRTPWEPDWNDCILFLEDVSTKPYQIDRMLTHLKFSGKLENVRCFIFGEMKDCIQTTDQGYTLQEVILDVLGPLGKPIYFGFPSGHVSGLNWTLPLGVRAAVSDSPRFTLRILEGAVS